MPINQDRIIAVISAGKAWQATAEALRSAINVACAELENRAKPGGELTPQAIQGLITRLGTVVMMNQPQYEQIIALDREQAHFNARETINAGAARRARKRRAARWANDMKHFIPQAQDE